MTGPAPRTAVVTALPKEHAAVSRLLVDSQPVTLDGDSTLYRYGTIPGATGHHEVVLACLTKYGNNTGSITATNLHRSFPSVRDIILVGICAGVPRPRQPAAHVRLGDVIVSSGDGVVQFDMGVRLPGEFRHRGSAPPPSATLLQAVNMVESAMIIEPDLWPTTVGSLLDQAGVVRPRREPKRDFRHPVDRLRTTGVPRIFRGAIGASNSLMKDPADRDRIATEFGLLGYEMEGSGVADAAWDSALQYLIVRGVCDYGDLTKDDAWQEYAAHVAAAYLQALLLTLPGTTAEHQNTGHSAITTISATTEVRTTLGRLVDPVEPVAVTAPATSPTGLTTYPITTQRLTTVCWVADNLLVCGGFDGRLYWVDPWTSAATARTTSRSKIRSVRHIGQSRVLVSDDHGRVWLAAGHDQDAVEICRTGSPAYALTPVNSRRFYSGDRAGNVTLWEVRETDALRLRVVDKHEGPVFGVDLLGGECVSVGATGELRTPSGTTVVASVALFAVCADDTHRLTVVGDASGHLHVIDRGERQEIPLHTDAIRSLVLDFPWVVTSSKDGTAKAFNIRTGFTGVLWEGPDYGYEISLSPDRTAVALVHGGGELVVRRFGKRLADLTDQDLETLIAAHG